MRRGELSGLRVEDIDLDAFQELSRRWSFRRSSTEPDIPDDPIGRHRLPGWNSLAEAQYVSRKRARETGPPRTAKRRPGRPVDKRWSRGDILTAIADPKAAKLWRRGGRRPE
jgi:hypothetical protein